MTADRPGTDPAREEIAALRDEEGFESSGPPDPEMRRVLADTNAQIGALGESMDLAYEEDEPCSHPCDHCRPDAWHGCVRPADHSGYHSCVFPS